MTTASSASSPTSFTSAPAQHEAFHDPATNPSMSQNVSECLVSECPTGADENRAAEVVSDGPPELNERQLAALELIVSGATDTAVAEALKVNRRTVYRWRVEDVTFRRELEARRAELYANDVDRLRSVLRKAVGRLEQQVSDPYERTALQAARTLIALTRLGRAVAAPHEAAAKLDHSQKSRQAEMP